MSYQSLLTTEYNRSFNEVLRFFVIAGNLLIFYFYCGLRMHGKFGPRIEEVCMEYPCKLSKDDTITVDPLTQTSSLDMIALILAIYVAMKQLTFGRPEIDSFKQAIYLLPQEKKSALVLFIFSIFKFWHQAFYVKGSFR